jgi:uncharacterized protein GlcG (DUF336 family)
MLELSRATTIVDGALKQARSLTLHPMTVAVLDAAGCLVAFKREDGSSLLRPEIAQAKAWGALGMGMGSRSLAQRATVAPAFINSITALANGRLVPVPGGVLIRSKDNSIIGAVGISGDMPDKDEACAIIGIEAAEFVADPGTN